MKSTKSSLRGIADILQSIVRPIALATKRKKILLKSLNDIVWKIERKWGRFIRGINQVELGNVFNFKLFSSLLVYYFSCYRIALNLITFLALPVELRFNLIKIYCINIGMHKELKIFSLKLLLEYRYTILHMRIHWRYIFYIATLLWDSSLKLLSF